MNRKEDKCRIEVQGEMTAERYASFTMLYVPLIGSDAAALYHTLVSIGTRNQKIRNHILIQTISRLNMEAMEKSRHVLEQYLLVKTFYDAAKNSYLYQVFMPKDGNEFLRHEVFGRLYLKEMGKDVYEFNKLSFAKPCEDKSAYQGNHHSLCEYSEGGLAGCAGGGFPQAEATAGSSASQRYPFKLQL